MSKFNRDLMKICRAADRDLRKIQREKAKNPQAQPESSGGGFFLFILFLLFLWWIW